MNKTAVYVKSKHLQMLFYATGASPATGRLLKDIPRLQNIYFHELINYLYQITYLNNANFIGCFILNHQKVKEKW